MKQFKLSSGLCCYQLRSLNASLLIVGGGPALSSAAYRDSMVETLASLDLTFYDYRGNGQSQNFRQFGYQFDLQDLTEVVTQQTRPMIILAHSYGGPLALQFTWEHPDLVAGLILVSTTSHLGAAFEGLMSRKQSRLSAKDFGEQMQLFKGFIEGARSRENIQRFVELECQNQLAPSSSRQRKWLAEHFDFAPDIFLANQDFLQVNLTSRVHAIQCPTLVISGAQDIIVPAALSTELTQLIPHSREHIIEDCGHWCFVEKPMEFQNLVRDFTSQST